MGDYHKEGRIPPSAFGLPKCQMVYSSAKQLGLGLPQAFPKHSGIDVDKLLAYQEDTITVLIKGPSEN